MISLVLLLSIPLIGSVSIAEDRANQPPAWKSARLTDGIQDDPYLFNLTVTDPDHNLSELNLTDDSPLFDISDTAQINFTPRNKDVGYQNFTVTATDPGGLNDTMNLSLWIANVNDPPTFDPVPRQKAYVDTQWTLNCTRYVDDPDLHIPDSLKDRLSYRDDTPRVSTNVETGICTWTPGQGNIGLFFYKVTVIDNKGRSAQQEISVWVTTLNAPIWMPTTLPDTTQGSYYSVNLTATDPDDPISNLTFTDDSPLFDISSTAEIAFLPENEHVGVHRFNVTVTDVAGAEDRMELQLTVNNINDPPVWKSQIPDQMTLEDDVYTLHLWMYADDPDRYVPEPNVTLTYSVYGLNMTVNGTRGFVEWIPTYKDVGDHVFTVVVSDGFGLDVSQDVNITVLNVNDPPMLAEIPQVMVDEDEPFLMQVAFEDEDLVTSNVTDEHTFANEPTDLFMINATTGVIEFTPGNDQVGHWNITIMVRDRMGMMDSIVVEFDVRNVNDAPSILTEDEGTAVQDEPYLVEYSALDVDEGDTLEWSLDTNASWLQLGGASWLQGTPANGHVGWYWVNMTVMDSAGAIDYHNFTLTVENVNDPPVITTDDVKAATEDETYEVDYEATDPDRVDAQTWSLVTDAEWLAIDDMSGKLYGTPTNDDVGIHDVEVTVTDDQGSSHTHSFDLVVENVNDLPIAGPPWPSTEATVGTEYRFTYNATDPDAGDVLFFALGERPDGMAVDSSTGEVVWVPRIDQVGEHQVELRISDGSEVLTDTWKVEVRVPPGNEPPTITSEPPDTRLSLFETFAYNVTAIDPETGGNLTFELVSRPEGMTIDDVRGHVLWTPGFGDEGTHTVTVRVNDGWGAHGDQTFLLTVGGEPDGNGNGENGLDVWPFIFVVVVIVIVICVIVYWRMR